MQAEGFNVAQLFLGFSQIEIFSVQIKRIFILLTKFSLSPSKQKFSLRDQFQQQAANPEVKLMFVVLR